MIYSEVSESFFFLSLIMKLTTMPTSAIQTTAKMTIIMTPLFHFASKSKGWYMFICFDI